MDRGDQYAVECWYAGRDTCLGHCGGFLQTKVLTTDLFLLQTKVFCLGLTAFNTTHYSIEGHKGAIMGLLAMPTIENFASAGMDTYINLWDMNTFRHLKTLKGHTKGVQSLSYRYKSTFVLTF